MNRLFTFFFLCLFSISLFAGESDDPIFVRLTTETERLPLYLTFVDSGDSDFDSGYAKKLEKVLSFDLDHNGMTYVLKSSPEKERLAGPSFDAAPKQADWKSLGAFYVVKMTLQNQHVSLRLFAQNADTAKTIEGIPLTGELDKDRRSIHMLADTLHKTLFGTPGIASTRVLYTLKTGQGTDSQSEVWEADYDGHNRRQITRNSGYAVMPLYVPPKAGYNAGSLFFVSYQTGQPKIYYQSLAEGGTARRLTYLKGNQLMPTISRQRDKLAFISDVTGNPDLFIQPFNPETGPTGKPYQIFATHLATQGSPSFHPDGSQIAFVSNKDGSPRIYILDVPAPGTSLNDIKATLITKRNRESSAPSWSPDGSKIAYCAITQGVRQIWVYDCNTREERQITQGPGNKENPTWAPNSLHLMFNSSEKDAYNLFLINLNQPEATKITPGRFPSWEP